jgi:hypothetical protein
VSIRRLLHRAQAVRVNPAATANDGPKPHEWVKHEPVTVGATPVWVCRGCLLYRTQEPTKYDLATCPTPLHEANWAASQETATDEAVPGA